MTKRAVAALSLAAAVAAVVLLGAALLSTRWFGGSAEPHLVPAAVLPLSPPASASLRTEVGVGSGQNADGAAAAQSALAAALAGKRRKPESVMVFSTGPAALAAAVSEIRREMPTTRIYGATSDPKGVLTSSGLVVQSAAGGPVVGLMSLASDDMTLGVGAASFRGRTPQEAARVAAAQAVASAGRGTARPRALFLASSAENARQEDVLAGISSVVGPTVPVLGARVGAVVLDDAPAGDGVAVAALYTDLPVGWTFEGGYDVSSSQSGVITRMDGEQSILEIDGRPALDVYDGWLGGGLRKLFRENSADLANDSLALNPLYVQARAQGGEVYSLFSHVWPTDSRLENKALRVGTRMREGERLHLANGTWETLLNRIANLPRVARGRAELESVTPVFAFGYVCSGVMAVIPPAERLKAPLLMSQGLGGTPFLAAVSWGEHGFLPGVGNRFGNLLSSFLVVGPPSVSAAAGTPAPALPADPAAH
jgi:hypothetical protein